MSKIIKLKTPYYHQCECDSYKQWEKNMTIDDSKYYYLDYLKETLDYYVLYPYHSEEHFSDCFEDWRLEITLYRTGMLYMDYEIVFKLYDKNNEKITEYSMVVNDWILDVLLREVLELNIKDLWEQLDMEFTFIERWFDHEIKTYLIDKRL